MAATPPHAYTKEQAYVNWLGRHILMTTTHGRGCLDGQSGADAASWASSALCTASIRLTTWLKLLHAVRKDVQEPAVTAPPPSGAATRPTGCPSSPTTSTDGESDVDDPLLVLLSSRLSFPLASAGTPSLIPCSPETRSHQQGSSCTSPLQLPSPRA